MPKLEHALTGVRVDVSAETAASLGAEWKPVTGRKPAPEPDKK